MPSAASGDTQQQRLLDRLRKVLGVRLLEGEHVESPGTAGIRRRPWSRRPSSTK